MNLSGLSFNALPSIDIPFRFFFTAMVFALGLALMVLLTGESMWLSRWTPAMLALTHGFALGIITSVMMGALLQILPVVSGVGVNKVSRVGSVCHLAHFSGVILLMCSFIYAQAWLKMAALLILTFSFSYYLVAVGTVVFKQLSSGATIIAIRLSLLALLGTVILGAILLSSNFAFDWLELYFENSAKSLTNLHALWGGIGWMAVLIIAVSFQIVPMFHVAPEFPDFIQKSVAYLIFVSLFGLMILFFLNLFSSLISSLFFGILNGLLLVFNGALLWVINQRKRKIPDVSIYYWQLSALSMLVISLLHLVPDVWLHKHIVANETMLIAAIFIYFYVLSIIQGMLIKILPFLPYNHLQQACLVNFDAMKFLPNMQQLLSKKLALVLFYCHLASGFALLLTIISSQYYLWFGSLLFIEFTLFLAMMLKTCRVYYRCAKQINQLSVN